MRHVEQDALVGGFWKRHGPKDTQLVSRDLDEVSSILQREVGPQGYEIQGRTLPFLTRIQFRRLDDLILSYAWFAPAMEITSAPTEPYYSLFFRLHGSSEYRLRRQVFVTSASCGALLPGMQSLQVRTKENWHVFGTQFAPGVIQLELSRMLGRNIVRPVEFDSMVDFNRGAGPVVKRMLMRLYMEAGKNEFEREESALSARQLQRSLISLILEGLRHNYSKFVNGPERSIAPWQLRAVEEFILENADQPFSLGDLAVVGGVSARSLQYAFRRRRGCSPMEFVQRVRLERVRDNLATPDHRATVTSIAMRWGFLHLGRFAEEYRARFNEKPSETLRRSLLRRGIQKHPA